MLDISERTKSLRSGYAGTMDTLREMAALIAWGRGHLPLIGKACSILRGVNHTEKRRAVQTLWRWVRDNVAYREDPDGMELLRSSEVTLHHGAGDCDCQTVLLGSLIASVNAAPLAFVLAKLIPGQPDFSHVFLAARLDGEWVPLETTERLSFGQVSPRIGGEMKVVPIDFSGNTPRLGALPRLGVLTPTQTATATAATIKNMERQAREMAITIQTTTNPAVRTALQAQLAKVQEQLKAVKGEGDFQAAGRVAGEQRRRELAAEQARPMAQRIEGRRKSAAFVFSVKTGKLIKRGDSFERLGRSGEAKKVRLLAALAATAFMLANGRWGDVQVMKGFNASALARLEDMSTDFMTLWVRNSDAQKSGDTSLSEMLVRDMDALAFKAGKLSGFVNQVTTVTSKSFLSAIGDEMQRFGRDVERGFRKGVLPFLDDALAVAAVAVNVFPGLGQLASGALGIASTALSGALATGSLLVDAAQSGSFKDAAKAGLSAVGGGALDKFIPDGARDAVSDITSRVDAFADKAQSVISDIQSTAGSFADQARATASGFQGKARAAASGFQSQFTGSRGGRRSKGGQLSQPAITFTTRTPAVEAPVIRRISVMPPVSGRQTVSDRAKLRLEVAEKIRQKRADRSRLTTPTRVTQRTRPVSGRQTAGERMRDREIAKRQQRSPAQLEQQRGQRIADRRAARKGALKARAKRVEEKGGSAVVAPVVVGGGALALLALKFLR